jgi:hypothetical protein
MNGTPFMLTNPTKSIVSPVIFISKNGVCNAPPPIFNVFVALVPRFMVFELIDVVKLFVVVAPMTALLSTYNVPDLT